MCREDTIREFLVTLAITVNRSHLWGAALSLAVIQNLKIESDHCFKPWGRVNKADNSGEMPLCQASHRDKEDGAGKLPVALRSVE